MINLFKSTFSQTKVKEKSNKHWFTLIFLIFLFAIILLLVIFVELISSEFFLKIDHSIAHFATTFQTREIIQFFIWITELGNIMVVLPFVTLLCITFVLLNRTLFTIPLFIIIIGSTAFTYLSKIIFQRSRPIEAVLVEQSYSFPSGHATFAIGFYGFAIYLLMRHSKSLKKQLSFFISGITIIILLGLSRIVLNAHYFSDVLAGYMIGLIWLIIGIKITEWIVSTQRIDPGARTSQKKQWFIYILFVCAFIYYLSYTIIYQPEFVSQNPY